MEQIYRPRTIGLDHSEQQDCHGSPTYQESIQQIICNNFQGKAESQLQPITSLDFPFEELQGVLALGLSEGLREFPSAARGICLAWIDHVAEGNAGQFKGCRVVRTNR